MKNIKQIQFEFAFYIYLLKKKNKNVIIWTNYERGENMISSIKELRAHLERNMLKSSKIFIIGHNSPDFDAIGSCLGLSVLAMEYGKECYIIINDEDSKIEPGVKKIIDINREKYHIINKNQFLSKVDSNSLLIVADTNKQEMISVGDCLDLFKKVIVIDHHSEGPTSIQTEDKYISEAASSACEIVSRVLNGNRVRYNQEIANYLLAGISLDTKRFKQNTTSHTHDVAEKLITNGADIDYVNRLFLEEFESFCRISNLIINGTIIKKYSESLLDPIQVSFTLNRNHPCEVYLKEDYAKAADRMMKFSGIDAAFTIGFIEPGIVHISARSGKRVNVGAILSEMNGGGTHQTAGGRIKTDDIFKVEEELMKKVPIGLSEDEDIAEEPQVIKLKQINKMRKD